MIKAYSLDLREKSVAAVKSGKSVREIAKSLNIGVNTIYTWLRLDKVGSLAPKKRTIFPQKVPSEKILSYVEANPDHTLKEIGAAVGLSASKAWKWTRKLGLTLKKSPRSTASNARKNAQNLTKN